MREKSLFIDGFAPPSPPMATVLAILLETAATSVRRSKGRVAPVVHEPSYMYRRVGSERSVRPPCTSKRALREQKSLSARRLPI